MTEKDNGSMTKQRNDAEPDYDTLRAHYRRLAARYRTAVALAQQLVTLAQRDELPDLHGLLLLKATQIVEQAQTDTFLDIGESIYDDSL
jgi:hypothetical protein